MAKSPFCSTLAEQSIGGRRGQVFGVSQKVIFSCTLIRAATPICSEISANTRHEKNWGVVQTELQSNEKIILIKANCT
jgi:hypothetical protein